MEIVTHQIAGFYCRFHLLQVFLISFQVDVNIGFTNPYKGANMVSYNPYVKKLFSWDHGSLLQYPMHVEY